MIVHFVFLNVRSKSFAPLLTAFGATLSFLHEDCDLEVGYTVLLWQNTSVEYIVFEPRILN